MKRPVALVLLCLATCGPGRTADGVIIDHAPLDGCSYLLEVDAKRFGIERGSLPLVRSMLIGETRTPVRATFSELGHDVDIFCGGIKRPFPGVTIHALQRL